VFGGGGGLTTTPSPSPFTGGLPGLLLRNGEAQINNLGVFTSKIIIWGYLGEISGLILEL
jgi:hypothetical protein